MASKQFNAIQGFTVGDATIVSVIDANANVTANALTATGNANVGNLGFGSGVITGTGNITAGNITAGNIIGIIAAGSNTITTTGNITGGNLIGPHANGNSNINIPAANGNVNISSNGVANVAVITSNAIYRGSYNISGFIYQTDTAPASPQPGDQWYNTTNGILFEYLNDGTSSQWVDVGSIPKAVSVNNIVNGNSNVNIPSANGNVTISSAGIANVLVITGTGANITGTANISGNANVGNIGATNGVFTNVSGNGANLSAITGGNVTGTVANANNASYLGTYAAASANTASTIALRDTNGNLSANFFIGNGSQLTGISASFPISNGNSNIAIPTANGNIQFSVAGNANILTITGTGANVTGTLNVSGISSFKTYTETETSPTISTNTLTLDMSTGTVFNVTVNSNITTLNITNVSATAGVTTGFILVFTYNGTPYSVVWPSSIRWANGNTAPTLTNTNNARDVFVFFTTDNGTSYNGFISGQNI